MKGIIMSGDSVPGVLAGTKTQTRRVLNPQPPEMVCTGVPVVIAEPPGTDWALRGHEDHWSFRGADGVASSWTCKPRYQVGETVYMKEAWQALLEIASAVTEDGEGGYDLHFGVHPKPTARGHESGRFLVAYRDFDVGEVPRWRSPLFMPQWASRAILRIERVRCERLQDITAGDALAEGIGRQAAIAKLRRMNGNHWEPETEGKFYRQEFADRWDAINGKRHPWASNPWVFVYEFCKVD